MDGLTTTGFINDKAPDAVMSTAEYSATYAEMINANADVRSEASLHRPGRHDHNIGTNGGMLFQDEECSLSTGSFTLFAVACLKCICNDSSAHSAILESGGGELLQALSFGPQVGLPPTSDLPYTPLTVTFTMFM